jgi:hypothetical protein
MITENEFGTVSLFNGSKEAGEKKPGGAEEIG